MNRRKFLAGAGTAGLAGLAGCMGVSSNPRSESSYTGYILDTEYESGLLFPNTEIHLKTHPTSGSSETFYLRIPDDEDILDDARTALEEGRRVTVTYERGIIENPFDAFGSHSVVTDIELHDETYDDDVA